MLCACTFIHAVLKQGVSSSDNTELNDRVKNELKRMWNKGQMMCMDTIPLFLTTVQVVRTITNKQDVFVPSVSHRLVTTEVRIRL